MTEIRNDLIGTGDVGFVQTLLGDGQIFSDIDRADSAFRAILEVLPAAIYATDAAGRITYYNRAAAALWGCQPQLGKSEFCGSWKLLRPDGTPLPHDQCPMAIALKEKRAVRGIDSVAERPDGTRIPFTPFPTPIFNKNGELVGAVNMLIDISDRKKAEYHFSALVDSSGDAIVSKDLDGIITSWNRGGERLFGYEAQDVLGRHISILIPADRPNEEPDIIARIRRGERIEHYETVRRRKDGSLVDISLTVSPIRDAAGNIVGASKIARDISERKRAELALQEQTYRFETLNKISQTISSKLDPHEIAQTVTDITTGLCGARFGAFFCSDENEQGESYRLYALSGAPREAFAKFDLPRGTGVLAPAFQGLAPVRSDDVRKDPRYGKSAPHYGMPKGHLPVTSYLAVPVVSRTGKVIGALLFGHDRPAVFTEESENIVAGIAAHAAIAIDNSRLYQAAQSEISQRRRAEEMSELLFNELNHRVKNTLATIHAIARQTFRKAPRDERDSFEARLQALASAHDLLTRKQWNRASIGDIVKRALAPFQERHRERFAIEGPEIWIEASRSPLLIMVVHELATNAVKYGALSNDTGKVRISWSRVRNGADHAKFVWEETGATAVEPPARKGFGSRLIERAISKELGKSRLEFHPTGVTCTLEIRTDPVAEIG